MKYLKILIFLFLFLFVFISYNFYLIKYDVFSQVFTIKNHAIQRINSFVTIVTVYYKFPGKHTYEEFTKWTTTFLNSVTSPLVVFTDHEGYSRFKTMAQNLNLNVTFYVTNSVWDILGEIEKWRGIEYTQNYLTKQNSLDPEKSIHNPNLYAVWNSKHYMIKLIAEKNPYKSEFFIYTDMGAWRHETLKGWPNVEFVKNVSKLIDNKALYGTINNIDTKSIKEEEIRTGEFVGIEGTFFAGSKKAIQNVAEAFYEIHDLWFKKGGFVGKDQSMMSVLAYIKYPNLVKLLNPWKRNCKRFNDIWLFYQVFFSYPDQYYCHEDRLSLIS